jgi:hypothetical protein
VLRLGVAIGSTESAELLGCLRQVEFLKKKWKLKTQSTFQQTKKKGTYKQSKTHIGYWPWREFMQSSEFPTSREIADAPNLL